MIIKDPKYPAYLRGLMGSSAVDAGDVPARPPATIVKAAPAPLKDDGPPSPPTPPVRSGGGGNNGGFGKWAKENPLIVLFLGLLGLLVFIAALSSIHDYYLRRNLETLKELNDVEARRGLPPAQPGSPAPRGVQPSVINDLVDGAEVTLPVNAKITLRGPMTVTFVNSAGLIKSFSGDFHLHVENSENWAWTPGYDSKSPPLTVNDFLGHLRKRTFPNRVTLTIKQGIVEINT